jgi:hypothetical protein
VSGKSQNELGWVIFGSHRRKEVVVGLGGRPFKRLEFDAKAERFTRDPEAEALIRRSYEPGHWAVPKGV